MVIVAGPPGSGKSTLFPVRDFGVDFFNADDVAASRNQGSYAGISLELRSEVNRELEQWIAEHTASGQSFAIQTTLRTNISLHQAAAAVAAGFRVAMIFVTLDSFERNVERVANRARIGGHSAPVETLRRIYEQTFDTLPEALRMVGEVIEVLDFYDNSEFGRPPRYVATMRAGESGVSVHSYSELPLTLREVLSPYLL